MKITCSSTVNTEVSLPHHVEGEDGRCQIRKEGEEADDEGDQGRSGRGPMIVAMYYPAVLAILTSSEPLEIAFRWQKKLYVDIVNSLG